MNTKIIFLECIYSLYLIVTILMFPILVVFSAFRGLQRYWKTNPQSIAGQVALITGAGRGLGRDIAVALAKLGCHIAIVDIQGKLAEETANYIAETYGVKTNAYKVDVSNFEQLLDLRRNVTNDLGDVTILINNAGILTLSSLHNPPPQEVQRMVNVNLIATIYTTQIFLPKMKQLNRGHIVNISSLATMMPSPLYAVYGATKSAVQHFTKSLRVELMQSQSEVTATTIFPTFLTTNERTDQLMKLTGGSKVGPTTDGTVVAQYLVSAMMHGDDEVTVPRIFHYHHKLLSLFSTYFMEKMVAVGSMSFWKKRDWDEVKEILKTDDIQRDL